MSLRSLPTRTLPENPDLAQLRRQAKDVLAAFRAGDSQTTAEMNAHFRGADTDSFSLHDAQFVIARAYGFESWRRLKAYVDGVTVHRLVEAVRAGDAARVRAILQLRPELAHTVEAWNNEHTALHHAVLHRMPDVVRTLIELGADPHAGISPYNEATTALTLARERGYDEIVAIIVEEEARREAGRPTLDQVPQQLRQAMDSGDENLVVAILQQQPELVNFRLPGDRRTLLHIASTLLLRRVAIWLLDHGAEVNARAQDGSTPLEMLGLRSSPAIRAEGLPEVMDLLLARGAELTTRSAVILGDEAFLKARHAAGELIPPQDDRGWLLRIAVDHNRPEILNLLLDFGLDPDARARVYDGEEVSFTWGSPLYQCVRHGQHRMARMLLERGADPNAHVYASGTPLSEAYGQRDEAMIALLERYGGKPNPAMAGFYRRKDLTLRLLSEHGDRALPDDGFGAGPVAEQLVSAAARGGDPEILQLALERVDWPAGDHRWYGALSKSLELWNHRSGPWCHPEWDRTTYLTCFRMVLGRCGPPSRQLRFGATLLHEIVAAGDPLTPEDRASFATAALDAGARLDLRDDLLRSTPLGWACRWGREELVRLFLDRGADAEEADAERWATPRAWAEKKGHAALLARLREHVEW